MRPISAATALLLFAGPVIAQCPVGEDLEDGIYVTYDDDSVTKYTGLLGGEVTEYTTITDGSGDVYIVPTLSGVIATGYLDGPGGTLDEQTRESIVFDSDPNAALPITAGTQFTTSSVRSFADGTDPVNERYALLIGPAATKEFAGCSYTTLSVTHTFVDDQGVYGLTQEYLPDLGIAIYTGYTEMGSSPEVYKVLEISAWAPR